MRSRRKDVDTPGAFPANRPLGDALEALYERYNRRCFVEPDPLQFLYEYPGLRDREIVALVASSLAYGRVAQILKSVSRILEVLGESPFESIMNTPFKRLRSELSCFRHRFTTGEDVASMLWAARGLIQNHGSLEAFFCSGVNPRDTSVLPALTHFARAFEPAGGKTCFLIPQPERGSACKRWNLFLRWMVRKDEVDPGGWDRIPSSHLIIPLDTHMYKICTRLGATCRKQADMRAALEITGSFSRMIPEDPVRYDFALTRLGIRSDTDLEGFFRGLSEPRFVPKE